MYSLKSVRHSDVSKEILDDIIRIKNIAWKHPYESQLKWINKNIYDDDIHVLLQYKNKFVGYLNLINITLEINGENISSLGVGNVCVADKGKGLGRELMNLVSEFIAKKSKTGFLLCNKSLVGFYGKSKWRIIDAKLVELGLNQSVNSNTQFMVFNYENIINKFKYNDRLF